jgi:hypothetical protein
MDKPWTTIKEAQSGREANLALNNHSQLWHSDNGDGHTVGYKAWVEYPGSQLSAAALLRRGLMNSGEK